MVLWSAGWMGDQLVDGMAMRTAIESADWKEWLQVTEATISKGNKLK